MKIHSDLKQLCTNVLLIRVEEQISVLKRQVEDMKESLVDDTKSSAGDKYETSRERISRDLNRLELQLSQHNKNLLFLNKLNGELKESVDLGAMVQTNQGIYFFSLALGKVEMESVIFYALSIQSPIGRALRGAKRGDSILFQGRKIEIKDVC
ncbi:GreA/GreB family elongation factor [Halosquirtibacter laminarini]|uniref:GreA/GreB family elongation factor n=1 Tax=Halosquirtibacter laminarini TaxID=3374600 RepID=A0AC61NH30_9BACT|nr:GreA/GreB family elongation factor [Prolixibacteraceae bacterium]